MIRIYDTHYRGKCREEWAEQIDCMSWLEANHPDRFPLCFHTPNEVKASAQYMQKRRKMGVKAGVSDIIDLGAIRGLFELKRLDRTQSSVTTDQRKFLLAGAHSGAFAAVCYGFEAFKLAYADYLEFIRQHS